MTRFVTSMRTPLTCCSQCADTPFPTLRTYLLSDSLAERQPSGYRFAAAPV